MMSETTAPRRPPTDSLDSTGRRPRPTALIVDDDPVAREVYKDLLRGVGYRVHEAADWSSAVLTAGQGPFDLLVLDLGLPGFAGPWVARAVRRRQARPLSVVVVSARPQDEIDAAASALGATAGVSKSASHETFLHVVNCLRYGSRVRELLSSDGPAERDEGLGLRRHRL